MTNQEKAQVRSEFYGIIDEQILKNSKTAVAAETGSTGLLFELDNGTFVEVRVVVKDEKFNIATEREVYAAKCRQAAERAAKHAEVEARKAAKAAEKADKTAKATEETGTETEPVAND